MINLFERLSSFYAPSGSEETLAKFIVREVSPYAECHIQPNGNVICFKKGKKSAVKKVMVDAHTDEVGIIATSYLSDGFIRFDTLGGINPAVMLGRRVIFKNGTIGVVGIKPTHLASADEKKKFPGIGSLYIDIGAKSEDEAKQYVKPGDSAVFISDYTKMSDDTVKVRAIDDRAGVAVLIALLKDMAEYDFCATFTVQEELGCRGAKTAAYSLNPDAAIVLEATTAADLHGVSADNRVCALGEGPVVSFMDPGTLYDKRLYNAAVNSGLKHQIKQKVAGGNNASAIHLSGRGCPTLAISLPCRYIHSPSSLASLSDLEDMYKLAKKLIEDVASGKVL